MELHGVFIRAGLYFSPSHRGHSMNFPVLHCLKPSGSSCPFWFSFPCNMCSVTLVANSYQSEGNPTTAVLDFVTYDPQGKLWIYAVLMHENQTQIK